MLGPDRALGGGVIMTGLLLFAAVAMLSKMVGRGVVRGDKMIYAVDDVYGQQVDFTESK